MARGLIRARIAEDTAEAAEANATKEKEGDSGCPIEICLRANGPKWKDVSAKLEERKAARMFMPFAILR